MADKEVTLNSRFSTTCSQCGNKITVNEKVLWTPATRKARHAVCPAVAGQNPTYDPNTVGAATFGDVSASNSGAAGKADGELHADGSPKNQDESDTDDENDASDNDDSDDSDSSDNSDDDQWWNEPEQQQGNGSQQSQGDEGKPLDPVTQAMLEKLLEAKVFVTRDEAKKFIKQLRREMKKAGNSSKQIDKALKQSKKDVEEAIKQAKEEILQSAPNRIEIVNHELPELGPTEFVNTHPQFATVLKLFNLRRPNGNRLDVYAHGGPGTSKSTTGMQAAQALNLKYYVISLTDQTSEYVLLGYNDASGKMVETDFYRAYKDGGVFCLEEFDNASANLLTVLNTAIDNGVCGFPNGNVKRHPDFILYANGNTNGEGGNAQFPDRRPFDGATKDRFAFVEFELDEKLEQSITMQINPNAGDWLKYVRTVRQFAKTEFPKLIVSPRASFYGALSLTEFNYAETANMWIFRGVDPESKQRILQRCPLPLGQPAKSALKVQAEQAEQTV